MPQAVDIEGIGVVEFPDDLTPEQLNEAISGDIIPRFEKGQRLRNELASEQASWRLPERALWTLGTLGERVAHLPTDIVNLPPTIAAAAGSIPPEQATPFEAGVPLPFSATSMREAVQQSPFLSQTALGPLATGTPLPEVAQTLGQALTSPEGVVALPAFLGGALPAKLAASAFSSQAAVHLPEALGRAAGVPEEERTQAIVDAAFQALVAGGPALPGAFAKGAETVDILRGRPRAEIVPPEEIATQLSMPGGGAPELRYTSTPTTAVPDALRLPPPGRAPGVRVPRAPRPEIPATPAERYQTVVDEIRSTDARTLGQIQQLFPRSNLSREQARVLRTAAWGAAKPQEVPNALQEREATPLLRDVSEQPEVRPGEVPAEEGAGGVPRGVEAEAGAGKPEVPLKSPEEVAKGYPELAAAVPEGQLLVEVRRADGKVDPVAFNGYYDIPKELAEVTGLPEGPRASVARKTDSGWSHTMLGRGEELLTKVPTPEEWAKAAAERKAPAAGLEAPPAAAAPMPPGPGAASPMEFVQRARARAVQVVGGQRPPGNSPPAVLAASAASSAGVRPQVVDSYSRFNSGQWNFYFGKLGATAKKAWDTLALGEFRMREAIGRDVRKYVTGVLDTLPRRLRKEGGKAFFDILDGHTFHDIEAQWLGRPGGAEVIKAAGEIKGRLEEIRSTIRDTKRHAWYSYLMTLSKPRLQQLFQQNINAHVNTAGYLKTHYAHALTRNQFPDDWGIADGSYIPHLFQGTWVVEATLPGSTHPSFITRAKTVEEAKSRIYELVKNDPQFAQAAFQVGSDGVVPGDLVRLGDARFWKMIDQLKNATQLTASEVRDAMRGIVGRQATKQKHWGSLKQRFGFTGYARDYEAVMTSYLQAFHRWKILSEVNQEVAPLIEAVKREGRLQASGRLEELLMNLWGKPSKSALEFDTFIRRIPGVRNFVQPLALDRWARQVRSAVVGLTLATFRFGVLNRLQPLQGLYPLVGERIMAEAKIMQHTAAGRQLLDQAGVTFDPGQFSPTRGVAGRLTKIREKLTGEVSNQELAFLAMYLHGTRQGLSPAQAISYGKLRGQLLTQFTPLVVDTPKWLEGPVASTLFQYKRFPIKQAELGVHMAQVGNLAGIARWLGVMATFGGLTYFLKQTLVSDQQREELQRKVRKEVGEPGATAIMYGVPGLLGTDFSGSLVLGDRPIGANVYEKAGRVLAGPAVSMTVEGIRSLFTEAREPISARQKTVDLLRRFPSLKPLAELSALADSDFDVRTPAGQVRFRRTFRETLMALGSLRTLSEAQRSQLEDASMAVEAESKALKNRLYVTARKSDADLQPVIDDIIKFNQRWPEFGITTENIRSYLQSRERTAESTRLERMVGKKAALLQPSP